MINEKADTKEDDRNEEFGIDKSLHSNEDYKPTNVVLPHFEA